MSEDNRRIDPRRLLASLGIAVEEDEGKELVARCPSGRHQDRKPSFTVHVGGSKNALAHCRSCNFDVDAYGLAMHVLGVQFPTAKMWVEEHAVAARERELASRVAVDLHLPALRRAFRLPPGVEQGPLEGWPSPPRDYLARRGVTADQVRFWRIGYAVEGRLAGRVVVPIMDGAGAVRSYVARSYGGQPVRYLTPHADERADASAVFGEWGWDGTDTVVVVEGALNALAVERETGENVAALGGSRLEPAVLAKLGRGFGSFVLLTDADHAGDRAAAALEGALSRKRVVRARMDEGVDPANAPPGVVRRIVGEALAELW